MSATVREFLGRGLVLGVWALVVAARPGPDGLLRVLGLAAAGLAVGVAAGAVRQLASARRLSLTLGLIDNPLPVALGLAGGTVGGLLAFTDTPPERVGIAVAAGLAAGAALWLIDRVRFTLPGRLAVAVLVVAPAVVAYAGNDATHLLPTVADRNAAGWAVLAVLPLYWVLTLAGRVGPTVLDADLVLSGLFAGLGLVRPGGGVVAAGADFVILFVLLVAGWAVYVGRVLPRLRAGRQVTRGNARLAAGDARGALAAFGDAVRTDPRHRRAAAGLRRLHDELKSDDLDAATLPLLNFGLLLDRAERLLVADRPPTAAERTESVKLLDLAATHQPTLAPRIDHLRAVAHAHAGEYDAAATTLSRLLDPAADYPDRRPRQAVLLRAWDLATRVHPQLVKRLGAAELAKPGRRLDALAAVETHLTAVPDDGPMVGFRRELYAGLTEAELVAGPTTTVNFDHLEQLGLSLLDDPARVDRGAEYLRMAARGLPQRSATLFTKLAEAASKLGRADEAAGYLGQVKRVGLTAGVNTLPADQKAAYAAAVKGLAEAAAARGDFAAAVDDYRLYVEAAGEDAARLKTLADLYARSPDPMGPLNALAITERGLLYAKADPELLARKDSLYFTVQTGSVAEKKDKVAGWFDVAHCVRKATAVANQKDADPDTLAYGLHLARLARVLQPASNAVRLAEGRLLLRRGERDAGLSVLEDVRQSPRGGGDEEDAWFLATRLLGDLYLDELNRPDLAVQCYRDFRDYQKSGGETLFRLGEAYEAAGDSRAAVQAYKAVTVYTGHPKYWDAEAAVRRTMDPRPR